MNANGGAQAGGLNVKNGSVIAILGVILAAVLFWPQEDDAAPADNRAVTSRLVTKPVVNRTSITKTEKPTAQWPQVTLDEVLACNPFAKIAVVSEVVEQPKSVDIPVPDPPIPEPTTELRSLEHVEVIYQHGDQRLAMIDSKIVRVGDLIPAGRIHAITEREVIVEVTTDPELPTPTR
jgi:hypothetical protein